jgi:hypothetical protein
MTRRAKTAGSGIAVLTLSMVSLVSTGTPGRKEINCPDHPGGTARKRHGRRCWHACRLSSPGRAGRTAVTSRIACMIPTYSGTCTTVLAGCTPAANIPRRGRRTLLRHACIAARRRAGPAVVPQPAAPAITCHTRLCER